MKAYLNLLSKVFNVLVTLAMLENELHCNGLQEIETHFIVEFLRQNLQAER